MRGPPWLWPAPSLMPGGGAGVVCDGGGCPESWVGVVLQDVEDNLVAAFLFAAA